MSKLFEYVETQLATFDEEPFCEVDAAVLTQACMASAPGTIPGPPRVPGVMARVAALVSPTAEGARFQDVVDALGRQGGEDGSDPGRQGAAHGAPSMDIAGRAGDSTAASPVGHRVSKPTGVCFTGLVPGDIRRLLFALAASPRFRDLRLRDQRQVVEDHPATQFGACTFTWRDRFAFVAFQGTDAPFVGWHENCDMAWADEVPAQRLARAYLAEVAPHLPRRLQIGGHSKGGNLALFAALRAPEGLRNRIERVWSFDGPGFKPATIAGEEYERLHGRVTRLVPVDAVVGMLLECPLVPQAVRCEAAGLEQHSVFQWEIEGDHFARAEAPSDIAWGVHDVVAEWLAGMDDERRHQVVDALFAAIAVSGARDARDLLCDPSAAARAFATVSRAIDAPTRDLLGSALGDLAAIAARRAGEDIAQALFGWMG